MASVIGPLEPLSVRLDAESGDVESSTIVIEVDHLVGLPDYSG